MFRVRVEKLTNHDGCFKVGCFKPGRKLEVRKRERRLLGRRMKRNIEHVASTVINMIRHLIDGDMRSMLNAHVTMSETLFPTED